MTLGRSAALYRSGDPGRPPVVLIPGAHSQAYQLEPLSRAFAREGFPVYALTLRGHGTPSAGTVDGLSMSDYVSEVRDAVHALKVPPILLGHSMGGLIALKVAENENLTALILLSAAPPAPVMATWHSLGSYIPVAGQVLRGKTLAPLADLEAIALSHVAPAKRAGIMAGFVPESGVAFRDMMLGRVKVDGATIRCPILSLFGKNDRLVPPWQMRLTARRLGATVLDYPGGHFPFEEPNAERVLGDLLGWVKGRLT